MRDLFNFSKENFMLDKKKNYVYMFILAFCSSSVLLFFNYMNNDSYKVVSIGGSFFSENNANLFVMMVGLIMILAIGGLMYVISNTFLKQKNKEIAILHLSGVNLVRISVYFLMQIMLVLIKAIPLGIVLFIIMNPIFNGIISLTTGVTIPLFYISSEAVVSGLLVIGIVIVTLAIAAVGFAYQSELIDLLSGPSKNSKPLPVSHIRMPKIVWWLLYAAALYGVTTVSGQSRALCFMCGVGAMALNKIIKKALSKVFLLIRTKFCINKKESMIAIGRASDLIVSLCGYICITFMAMTFLMAFMIETMTDTKIFSILCMSYFIIIVLMNLALFYRNLIETPNQLQQFRTLYYLGFQRKQLNKINRLELFILFIMMIISPIIFGGIMIVTNLSFMPLSMGLILIGFSVLCTIISLIATYYYRKRLLMKEGALS